MFGGVQLRAPASPHRRRGGRVETILEAFAATLLGSLVLGFLAAVFQIGAAWRPGQTKVRPGTYVRVVSTGISRGAAGRGTVAALVRGSWGPIAEPVEVLGQLALRDNFGDPASGTFALVQRILAPQPDRVLVVRQGTGGEAASLDLEDALAAVVVTLDAKYPGDRGNGLAVTVRDALVAAGQREYVLTEGTVELEKFTYEAAADEAQALTDAINEQSRFLDATYVAAGDGTVADVQQTALAGGTDPTVDGAALTEALDALTTRNFSVLAVDTVESSAHASVASFIDARREEGQRIMAVVGEPTSVAFATRRENAEALNNKAIVYVGNGFAIGEDSVEGYEAAGRVAGAIAAAPLTASMTNHVIEEATDVIGALSHEEAVAAIQSGLLTFTRTPQGQVAIEYGITSLSVPGPDEDEGWMKIRRVRTRDFLVMDIVTAIDPLRGKVNNDDAGRAAVQAKAGGVVSRYVAAGALLQGSVFVDPDNNPAGDFAYFVVDADDLDSIEKLYMTFQYRFSPAA